MQRITASELARLMACQGSRLLGKIPPFDDDRTVADEGDAVHWLIEQVFRRLHTADELVDRKAPNGVFITGDMVRDSAQYLQDICSIAGDVEVQANYSGATWEVAGRADFIGWGSENDLIIDDFKYGFRIIEPHKNWTLISHAIGFILNSGYVPTRIKFRIYQPRAFHPEGKVREWAISYEELIGYWQQIQSTLDNPSDLCVTGPHCYKCASQSLCPAFQVATSNAIDTSYMAFDSEISNEELSVSLDTLKRAQEVLKQAFEAYKELALHRLREGKKIPDYTIDFTKGDTQWNEGLDAETILLMTGIDVSKKEMITPTQAKKLGMSETLIKSFTNRPTTGLKLVRQSIHSKATKLLGEK
jgi:hypothetical protein